MANTRYLQILAAMVVIFIIALLYYNMYYKYSWLNTSPITACALGQCENYNVHNHHSDKEQAAAIMDEITRRNRRLIEHLENKYLRVNFAGMNPDKSDAIDVINGSELFQLDANNIADIKNVSEHEYLQERINQLIKNYNPDKIYEISPLNAAGVTSYTEDKRTLILCLRKKQKNRDGDNELHDINTITFVVVHELSHMMNNLWGHKTNFWALFKFMLMNAVECGIYRPIDYTRYPIVYCGLKLTYNPLFDPNL